MKKLYTTSCRLHIALMCACLLLAGTPPHTAAQTAMPDIGLDLALAQALGAFRADERNPYYYREVGRVASESGAVIYAAVVERDTHVPVEGLIELLLAVRRDGVWQVYLPGTVDYNAQWAAIPPSVAAAVDARPFKPEADLSLVSAAVLDDYGLPFLDGAFGVVTRSYWTHGLGQIDFDLTGTEIAAMKRGEIVYADDTSSVNAYTSGEWWYWNTLIIRHGEHEFALYGHIAHDSIPDWISAACPPAAAEPCSVPVEAGEVIALEGSTGYSSNNHLHVEFGQAFGRVAYRDRLDGDGDGNRDEPRQTVFVYREYNAGFRGYTGEDVAGWAYGTREQASHAATARLDAELIRNGDFSAETSQWRSAGQLSWWIENGALYTLRLNTADPPDYALFYQDTYAAALAGTAFEATLRLGNPGGAAKVATVRIMNAAGRDYGSIECEFVLAPGTPLQPYAVRGVADRTWANVRVQVIVNPADSAPALVVDDVSLRRVETATAACAPP